MRFLLRLINLLLLVVIVIVNVTIPPTSIASEPANTNISLDNQINGYFHHSGYIKYGERCHELPIDARTYTFSIYTNGIADFYIIEHQTYTKREVERVRVEMGSGYMRYYLYSFVPVTRLEVCVTNYYVYGSSYNIGVTTYSF